MKLSHLAPTLTLLVVACGDPLIDPQTVIGLRVLSAKLSTDDDPTIAKVGPGKSATLSWLVVADQEREYTAMTVFCKAEPGSFGVPRCGATFLEQQTEGSTDAPPTFAFELPDDFSAKQEWLSFLACVSRVNRGGTRTANVSRVAPTISQSLASIRPFGTRTPITIPRYGTTRYVSTAIHGQRRTPPPRATLARYRACVVTKSVISSFCSKAPTANRSMIRRTPRQRTSP